MKVLKFQGLMAPVFTGFRDETYQLNVDIVPAYAEYLAASCIKGVLVNGTTGEGVSMTTAERKANLEAWMKEADKHDLTIMVQIGGTSFTEVLELARHAVEQKVHALLCLPELFFYPSSVAEVVTYLRDVGESAPDTPLFYYHIPMFTRVCLDTEELVRKCKEEVPSFGGIKFTHNNLEELQRTVQVDQDLVCFLGNDQLILPGLMYGCHSTIATTINLFPHVVREIYQHFQDGNHGDAQTAQDSLSDCIRKCPFKGNWVSVMKWIMQKYGGGHFVDVGPVRKPLVAPSICEAETKPWVSKHILYRE